MPNPTSPTTDAGPADPEAVAVAVTIASARRALAALDLTRLERPVTETDTGTRNAAPTSSDETEAIVAMCTRAATPFGTPAAVCVFPGFVTAARQALTAAHIAQQVRIAAVANFPHGQAPVDDVRREIDAALEAGADEIDLVFPYRALIDGDAGPGRTLVTAARAACEGATLKVILETGELAGAVLIDRAGRIALDCGADFLKTSTGKVAVNATPAAAGLLLELIRDTGSAAGIKVSGGIRDVEAAAGYFNQADRILGADWACPAHFRIGASGLLDDIVRVLEAAR